jgi:hypothetical protein
MGSVGELDRLARSFERHLYAENKSPKTVETYGEAIQQLRRHVADCGVDTGVAISREHIEEFIAKLVSTKSLPRRTTGSEPSSSSSTGWPTRSTLPSARWRARGRRASPSSRSQCQARRTFVRCFALAELRRSRTVEMRGSSGCWPTPVSDAGNCSVSPPMTSISKTASSQSSERVGDAGTSLSGAELPST